MKTHTMQTHTMHTINAIGFCLVVVGALTACQNPFKAGLGEKVDINPAVIVEVRPASGAYIRENGMSFEAHVTDDTKVTAVDVYYQQERSDVWKKMPMELHHGSDSDGWWKFEMVFDGEYLFNDAEVPQKAEDLYIDNQPWSLNGDFYLYIVAHDTEASHETKSDPNSYLLKLGPPEISMNSPYLDANFWETISHSGGFYNWDGENAAQRPVIYKKGDILGNVFDSQGVKSPYPRIKMWNPNNGETEQDAPWITADEYIGPAGWDTRYLDPAQSSIGAKNIGFRLNACERDPSGNPGQPLGAASLPYKFRIMAADLGESASGNNRMVSFFPPTENYDVSEFIGNADLEEVRYHPEWGKPEMPAAEFYIQESEGPPTLDIYYNTDIYKITNNDEYPDTYIDEDFPYVLPLAPAIYDIHTNTNPASPLGQDARPSEKYIGGDGEFVIEARARHGSGIRKAMLVLKTGSGEKTLQWALGLDNDYNTTPAQHNDPRWVHSSKSQLEREYLFLSPIIKKGASIPIVDEDGMPTGEGDCAFTEGEYTLYVRIWENAVSDDQAPTEKSFVVQIIDTLPDIILTNVRAAKTEEILDAHTLYTVNGVFRFTAIISDDFGVEESRWWLLSRGDPASDVVPDWDTPTDFDTTIHTADGRLIYAAGTGTTQLSPLIDTLGGEPGDGAACIPDGDYTIYVMAVGKSGNWAHTQFYFKVDQASDIPTIEITSPVPGSYVSVAANLRGILADDDNVGSYNIEYVDPVSGDWISAYDSSAIDPPPFAPNRELDLNLPLGNLPGMNTDGEKRIRVTVYDHPASKLGADLQRAPIVNAPPFTEGWNAPEHPGYAAGRYILEFTRDTVPPLIEMSHPAAPPYVYREAFTFWGRVSEFCLDDIHSPGAENPQIKWTIDDGEHGREGYIAAGDTAPEYTWTLALAPAVFNGLAEGNHTIRFDALDRAGNTGSTQLVFTKDTEAPAIELINIEKVYISAELWTAGGQELNAHTINIMPLHDTSPSIRGSFNDDYSRTGFAPQPNPAAGGAAQYYYEFRIYDSVTLTDPAAYSALQWETVFLGADPGKSVNWNIPLNGASDGYFWSGNDGIPNGVYWLDIRVTDRLGNQAELTNIAFSIDRSPPNIIMESADPGGGGTFGTNPPVGTIYGVQADAGHVLSLSGKVESFSFDSLMVAVNNSDPYELKDEQQNGKDMSGTLNQGVCSTDPMVYTWKWALTRTLYDSLSEGMNSITLTAFDTAGRETAWQYVFIKDTVPPGLNFHNLSPGGPLGNNFVDTTFKIQGVAEDDNGVYSIATLIEMWTRPAGPWVPVSDTTGSVSAEGFTLLMDAASTADGSLGTTRNWNKNIGDGGLVLEQGHYRITLRVSDRANPPNLSLNGIPAAHFTPSDSAAAHGSGDEVQFMIDKSTPNIDINPSPIFVNGKNHHPDHPFYASYAAYYTDPPAPTEDGFYLTGTAVNAIGGLTYVEAYVFEGNNRIAGPYKYPDDYVPRPSPDSYEPWNWGILIPKAVLQDGKTYSVEVNAVALGGRNTMRMRDFSYDISPPTYSIIMPGMLESVVGLTIVRGTSNDNNAVSKVEYQIGKDMNTWMNTGFDTGSLAPDFDGGLYSWTYTFYASDSGPYHDESKADLIHFDSSTGIITPTPGLGNVWRLPFRIRVTDIAGNQFVNDLNPGTPQEEPYFLILDPDGDIPKATFSYPDPGKSYGGEVRVSGTANDNNWMYAVLVRTYKGSSAVPAHIVHYPVNGNDMRKTNDDGWALATFSKPGLSVIWDFAINQFGELNSADGTQQDVIVEVMPIDSKAFATCADLPDVADINYFSNNPDQNRLGDKITRQFKVDSTMPAIENVIIKRPNDTIPYQMGVRAAGEFTIHAEVTGAGGISKVQWKSAGAEYTNDQYEDMLNYTNTGSGIVTSPHFTIDDPIKANGDSALVTITSGSDLTAGMKYMIDNTGSLNWTGIGALLDEKFTVFVYNGQPVTGSGSAWIARGNPVAAPYELSAAWEQRFHYPLSITIDSTTRFPVTGTPTKPSSGSFLLSLKAEDFTAPSPYMAQSQLNIQIDNFYPTNEYHAPRNANSKNYVVQGIAVDIGTNSGVYGGIKEALVYFKRGSVYYNPMGAAWGDGLVPAATSAKNIKETQPSAAGGQAADSDGVVALFNNYPAMPVDPPNTVNEAPLAAWGAARITRNEVVGDANGNGYTEYFDDKGGKVTWGFIWDTTQFDDGYIELHYIVIDQAGNATHYCKKDLYINNNPPVIAKITLKTDHTFSHTVGDIDSETVELAPPSSSSDQARIHTFRHTNFYARNYMLDFVIDTMTGSGNGDKTFRVSPVQPGAMYASTAMAEGEIYTIEIPGDTQWTLLGASSDTVGSIFVYNGTPATNSGGEAAGSGTARHYTPVFAAVGDRQHSGIGAAVNTDTIRFGTRTDWTSGGNDSDADFGDTDNRIPDGDDRLFVVKVFDTTVNGSSPITGLAAAENDQQSDMVLVGLSLHNKDTEEPVALINPFHWNGIHDNSLYQNKRENGHIELEDDLPASFITASSGLKDADPKVSGQVSIRGTVTDNNIVDSLWVRMDGFAFPGATASSALVSGQTYFRIAEYTETVPGNNDWQLIGEDQWAANGWKSTVTLVSLDQDGHKLNWQLDIDTGKRPLPITAVDQVFRILAQDISFNQPTTEDSIQTGLAARTACYRMDIVPYISGIVTDKRSSGGLKNENIRSADGKYSVIKGSDNTFITVKGFNLDPVSGGVRIQSAGQLAGYDPGDTPVGTSAAFGNVAQDYRSFTMTNDLSHSGYLTVYNAGIGTLNNINNNDALGSYNLSLSSDGTGYELIPDTSDGSDEENMPNREADRYYSKNITLNDDRYLQFYTVQKTDAKGYYPVMMMEGENPVFGYVDLKGGSSGNATIGSNTNAGTFYPSHAMPQRTRFNYADGTRQDTEYLIKASIWDQMGMTRDDSGRYLHATTYNRDGAHFHLVYDRFAELHRTDTNGTTTGTQSYGTAWGSGTGYSGYTGVWAYSANNNAITLESNNYTPGLLLDRYQYPKLIARGNSVTSYAHYYMSYFDSNTNELIFRNFRIGTNGAANGGTNRLFNQATPTDAWASGSTTASPVYAANPGTNGRPYNTAYTNLTASTTIGADNGDTASRKVVTGGASTHFDMAVDSNGRAILVYYDEANGKLVFKYSGALTGANPAASPVWTNSPVNSSLNLPLYTGMYVSMVIDSGDHLHVAAFDALNSTLRYIFVDNVAGSDLKAVTVDQYGSVGNWTSIKLHPSTHKPYIAYYNATETGGRDPIKIAWSKEAVSGAAAALPGVDSRGYTTGAWEYRTVPARDPPQGGSQKFQKVNLDFRPAGDPILGYLATNIEFSYPVGE